MIAATFSMRLQIILLTRTSAWRSVYKTSCRMQKCKTIFGRGISSSTLHESFFINATSTGSVPNFILFWTEVDFSHFTILITFFQYFRYRAQFGFMISWVSPAWLLQWRKRQIFFLPPYFLDFFWSVLLRLLTVRIIESSSCVQCIPARHCPALHSRWRPKLQPTSSFLLRIV